MNAGFMKAVNLTGEEFSECVRYYGKVWLPGRQYVVEAVEGRHNVHASGEIFQVRMTRSLAQRGTHIKLPFQPARKGLEFEFQVTTCYGHFVAICCYYSVSMIMKRNVVCNKNCNRMPQLIPQAPRDVL